MLSKIHNLIAIICLLCMASSDFLIGQYRINGTIHSEEGNPLEGANVVLESTLKGATSDIDGKYMVTEVPPGTYIMKANFIGYNPVSKLVKVENTSLVINFILENDLLALGEVVVTGVFNPAAKLNSSVAISTLNSKEIALRNARGTGDLLSAVPGNSIDMGGGEVGAQVYPRGLSTGAVADIGFKYSSLQEDGLPVMSTQFQFAVIDMFHRADATVARLEAIRGGSASISAANSPGGIFNLISRTGTPEFRGLVRVGSGIHGQKNTIIRTDMNFSGPLWGKGWTYNVGGFYRFDEGARNLSFTANKGGQLKANLMKSFDKGFIKFYSKFLDDQVIFYKQLPVTDLNSPAPFTGFDLNYSSLIVNSRNKIPSAANPNITRTYDAADGISVQNYSAGIQFLLQFKNGWEISNNLKYGYFEFDHYQSSGHNLLPTVIAPNPIHRLPNSQFNSYTYRDAETGEILAQFENGQPVVENQLGDKVFLTLGKTVTYQVNDFINQFSFSKHLDKHHLTFGVYFGYADIQNTLNLDFVLGRFEPSPRLLLLSHPNPYAGQPGQPDVLNFTDHAGYFAYGFGTYTNFFGNSQVQAIFLNDVWNVNSKLTLDLGLRLESTRHTGKKERWDTFTDTDPVSGLPLGLDSDPSTLYDSFFKYGTSDFFDFDFTYSYWSSSLGLNYLLQKRMALFTRFTRGIKSPEMTYYINNFVNVDFEKGFEEEVIQAEGGVKFNASKHSVFLTGFYSYLNNFPFQLLVVSGDIGQFTPATLNSARSIGLEIEAAYRPWQNVNLNLIATIQDPQFVEFNYYNINRTGADFSDDFIERFDGNTINEVPRLSFDLTPSYQQGAFRAYLNWRYFGKRYANRRNTLTLPNFNIFNAGVSLKINHNLNIALNMNNVFNSAGLMNFEGVGIPGTTGEDITPEMIENVVKPQNRPYFVRPILPRGVMIQLSSEF